LQRGAVISRRDALRGAAGGSRGVGGNGLSPQVDCQNAGQPG